MKKQIIISFLLITLQSSWSQQANTTNIPCTSAIAMTVKGKWINSHVNAGSVNQSQKLEAFKRLDVLHDILLKMFPEPTGVDVRVIRSAGIGYFGSTRKYRLSPNGDLSFDYVKLSPNISYSYFANFSPHYCAHTDKGILFMPGSKNENSDGTAISVNDFTGLIDGPAVDDDWTIKGLPVRRLSTVINEKWKNYELYGDVRSKGRYVLIHRNGMLPYKPVTRKQYLDRCLAFTDQLHDKMIGVLNQQPVRSPEVQEAEKKAKLAKFEKDFGKDPKRLKSNVDYYLSGYKTDQQRRDEQVTNAKKNKETELKKFIDEMEKTTSEGLLDSPAIVQVMYYSNPAVFETDPMKGFMLVTENPDYIRKELPSYIPQFMVLSWKWNVDFYPVHKEYEKLFLQDFPVEKLQAMIDK